MGKPHVPEDIPRATDEILLAALSGVQMPNRAIDMLPPWRARLVVTVAYRAGGKFAGETTIEDFDQAAKRAGRQDAKQAGWWHEHLGLDPRPELDPAPPYVPPSGPPAGWKFVREVRG